MDTQLEIIDFLNEYQSKKNPSHTYTVENKDIGVGIFYVDIDNIWKVKVTLDLCNNQVALASLKDQINSLEKIDVFDDINNNINIETTKNISKSSENISFSNVINDYKQWKKTKLSLDEVSLSNKEWKILYDRFFDT